MKLLSINSPKYLRRLAREINLLQPTAPYYKSSEPGFDGRRVIRAWVKHDCLYGRSLNGEEWALNPEQIYDGNGNQVCASRQASSQDVVEMDKPYDRLGTNDRTPYVL